ncbi:MAG TPA: hypothetical protein VJS92_10820 [Candidatus Polarisedimenticolaceae bacterium]|nr:hypothetical protein [Candidatus Polarisedimenticolaceae bacterium]
MRATKRVLAIAAIAPLLLLGLARAGEAKKLEGDYVWSGSTNPVVAAFTPTAEGKWDVAFNFEIRGVAHEYRGTAEGSLTSGRLQGKVFDESKGRSFTFEGAWKDGTFRGTHAETTGGGNDPTGTIRLQL